MYPIILDKDKQTSGLEIAKYLPHIQQHFMKPNVFICYGDLILSSVAGNFFMYQAIYAENWSLVQLLWIIASAITLFRASVFIHESYHLGTYLRHYELLYNLIHGFLHKLPAYCYTPHRYHHSPATYGTISDPEYEALGGKHPLFNLIIAPWIMMSMLPVFFMFRWGILPVFLPFLSENARKWIYINASTLVLNKKYKRAAPTQAELKQWYLQDFGCFVYTLVWVVLMLTDMLPWSSIAIWFAVHYILWVCNFYRVIISHRYFTEFDATTHKQQVIDSGTLSYNVLNFWLYPVGLRYHALHHMLPQIPYHYLGKAHRWLMETLPQDHPYRVTVNDSYFKAVSQFLAKKF